MYNHASHHNSVITYLHSNHNIPFPINNITTNTILTKFVYFLSCPQLCSNSTRNAKGTDIVSFWITNTCAKNICIKNTCIRGTFIEVIYVGNICVISIYTRGILVNITCIKSICI